MVNPESTGPTTTPPGNLPGSCSFVTTDSTGEANVGLIYRDELGEKRLKAGDVYRIPVCSLFCLVNIAKGQRLQIICSLNSYESLGLGSLQSFFIGGGINPQSVLAGFDQDILTNAFSVSSSELMEVLTSQQMVQLCIE